MNEWSKEFVYCLTGNVHRTAQMTDTVTGSTLKTRCSFFKIMTSNVSSNINNVPSQKKRKLHDDMPKLESSNQQTTSIVVKHKQEPASKRFESIFQVQRNLYEKTITLISNHYKDELLNAANKGFFETIIQLDSNLLATANIIVCTEHEHILYSKDLNSFGIKFNLKENKLLLYITWYNAKPSKSAGNEFAVQLKKNSVAAFQDQIIDCIIKTSCSKHKTTKFEPRLLDGENQKLIVFSLEDFKTQVNHLLKQEQDKNYCFDSKSHFWKYGVLNNDNPQHPTFTPAFLSYAEQNHSLHLCILSFQKSMENFQNMNDEGLTVFFLF